MPLAGQVWAVVGTFSLGGHKEWEQELTDQGAIVSNVIDENTVSLLRGHGAGYGNKVRKAKQFGVPMRYEHELADELTTGNMHQRRLAQAKVHEFMERKMSRVQIAKFRKSFRVTD